MKVYLIKTPEYDKQSFLEVKEILTSYNGPMVFEHDFTDFTNDFNFQQLNGQSRFYPLSWEDLFAVCDKFREAKRIDENDFVVLLTKRRNELNWFSSFEQGKRNIFVHTGDWELFVQAHHKYPVAHNVIENVLNVLEGQDLNHLYKYIHKEPIGCYNDFCEKKSQIILKLRTADICPVCLDRLKRENVDPALIYQAVNIFENIRKQTLFRQGFTIVHQISKIKVTKDYRIFLTDYGNIEVQLPGLYKALYLLYLEHPEGIEDTDFDSYKGQLKNLYFDISPSSSLQKMSRSIDLLCNPLEGSKREKRSFINRKIKDKLGENGNNLVDTYCITGKNNEPKKINIDRELVTLCYK